MRAQPVHQCATQALRKGPCHVINQQENSRYAATVLGPDTGSGRHRGRHHDRPAGAGRTRHDHHWHIRRAGFSPGRPHVRLALYRACLHGTAGFDFWPVGQSRANRCQPRSARLQRNGTTYEVFWTPTQNIRVGAQYTASRKSNGDSLNPENNTWFGYIGLSY